MFPRPPFVRTALLIGACLTQDSARGELRSKSDRTVARPNAASGATSVPGRRLVLGRVVSLTALLAERTVTTKPPEEEINDPTSDVALVRLEEGGWGQVAAFRLSTGEPLWRQDAYAPCKGLTESSGHLYAACGDKFLSYGVADGAVREVDPGPNVVQGTVSGSFAVSYRRFSGQVTLFDAITNKRLASRRLPELGGTARGRLVASPSGPGICVYGRHIAPALPRGWGFKVGCYDAKLSPVWSKTVSFELSPEAGHDLPAVTNTMVHQAGPRYLVLNDQLSQSQRSVRGVLVRLRDGQITSLGELTFATLEDERGERITAPGALDIFRPLGKPQAEHENIGWSDAVMAVDGRRAFVLVVNQSTSLAAVDLPTGRVVFRVALAVGAGPRTLEVAAGLPIVRTQFVELEKRWRATIHDPNTGRVLYRDERNYH